MKLEAYLPCGRKVFYNYMYRRHMMEAGRGSAALSEEGAQVHHRARANPDHVLGELPLFMKCWRVEMSWLIICKSVCMFTKCSACEYLKLLIAQTPRDQEVLREALKGRLGAHFQFQADQRLAMGRVEEQCAQSGGARWLMLIDKMDQTKSVLPTVWSQLCTPMFKDLEKRLIVGLIGSMYFGTTQTTHHVRSCFKDQVMGAEMQCSTILQNFHAVAMAEGHLPEEFNIGADNTYKETKNQCTIFFLVGTIYFAIYHEGLKCRPWPPHMHFYLIAPAKNREGRGMLWPIRALWHYNHGVDVVRL